MRHRCPQQGHLDTLQPMRPAAPSQPGRHRGVLGESDRWVKSDLDGRLNDPSVGHSFDIEDRPSTRHSHSGHCDHET